MFMKTRTILILAVMLMAGCKSKTGDADAFGNFEATEVIVSSETNGRILKIDPTEGTNIEQGQTNAIIDTTIYTLQENEIVAAMKSIRTRILTTDAQNEILSQQIKNIAVNISRTEKMMKDDAATEKQYDDLTGQVEVLKKQISANNTTKVSTAAELAVYESKKATIKEQINRCTVKSPLSGAIIEKYSEAGEITAAGKPLVKIADLAVMKLKAYVSGGEIGKVKIGQQCTVRIDDGKSGYNQFAGTVSYISGKAEFTPKIIQTKEERVTLVYAVKVDVRNEGALKAGMPGEVVFK